MEDDRSELAPKRHILVFGATGTLGAVVASRLAENGYTLLLAGRDFAKLETLRKSLPNSTEHTSFSPSLNAANWDKEFKEVANLSGPLDGMVVTAGRHAIKLLRHLVEEDFQEILYSNVTLPALLLRAFRQKSVRGVNASVVFVSSVASTTYEPGLALYSASKAALEALAKTMAIELKSEKIRVNVVQPGLFESPTTDKIERTIGTENFSKLEGVDREYIGKPESVANVVDFLLSSRSAWVNGATFTVDGAYSLAR